MNFVKIATSNKENELYILLLKKYDIDRKWNELDPKEQKFCMNLFKTNDPDVVIKQFDKLKETIAKLKLIKEEIGER